VFFLISTCSSGQKADANTTLAHLALLTKQLNHKFLLDSIRFAATEKFTLRRSGVNTDIEFCYDGESNRNNEEGNKRAKIAYDGAPFICFTYDTSNHIFRYSPPAGSGGSTEHIAYFKNDILQLEIYQFQINGYKNLEISNQNEVLYKSSDTSSISFITNPLNNKSIAIVTNKDILIKIDTYLIVSQSGKRHLLQVETDSTNKFYPNRSIFYVAVDNSQLQELKRNKGNSLVEISKPGNGLINYCNLKSYYRAAQLLAMPINASAIDTVIFVQTGLLKSNYNTSTKAQVKYNSLGFVTDTKLSVVTKLFREGKLSCEDYNVLTEGWRMSQKDVENMYLDTFTDSFILFLNNVKIHP
jgi:hypothetical protein